MILNVGDEIYKARFGKKISYYKIRIMFKNQFSSKTNSYKYIIKGNPKDTYHNLGNPSNSIYSGWFFMSKIEFLKCYENHPRLSEQVKDELRASKTKRAELWI